MLPGHAAQPAAGARRAPDEETWPTTPGGRGASAIDRGDAGGTVALPSPQAHEIDLTRLSVTALIDQLAAALRYAPAATPLGQKGAWVVMAAWLVQLRSVSCYRRTCQRSRKPKQRRTSCAIAWSTSRRCRRSPDGWTTGRSSVVEVFTRGCPEGFVAAIGVAHGRVSPHSLLRLPRQLPPRSKLERYRELLGMAPPKTIGRPAC